MAFNVGSITAEIELNGQQFIAELKNADEVLNAFGASARDAANESSAFGEIVTGALRRVGELSFDLLVDGLTSIVDLFGKAIEASDEFEVQVEGLSVALQLRGLGDMKDQLVETAVALEDVTKFGRNTTVEVERLLTVGGVADENLAEYTETVLGFAQAFGVDTASAAKLFVRSLSGSVGRISLFLPAVKELGGDALKAGGAFKLAGDSLGLFARAAGQTSDAIESRFFNKMTAAFQAFGDAISPVFDTLLIAGTNAAKALAAAFVENQGAIQAAFAQTAKGAYDALLRLISALGDVANTVRLTYGAFVVFWDALKLGFTALADAVKATFTSIWEVISAPFKGLLLVFQALDFEGVIQEKIGNALNVAGDFWKQQIHDGIVVPFKEAGEGIKISVNEAAGLADETSKVGGFADTLAKVVQSIGDGFAKASEQAGHLADGTAKSTAAVVDAADQTTKWRKELDRVLGVTRNADGVIESIGGGMTKAAKAAKDTAGAAGEIKGATDGAVDSTGALTDGFTRAAAAARSVGESSFSTTAGGFGQFGADNFASLNQNRQGGTFNLGLDSSSKTAAYLQAVQGRFSKLSDIYGSRTQAGIQYQKIAALLQSQIRDETKAFTQGIIDELNRQGIFDTTQRNAYISARFDEARRLGVLPRGAAYNTKTSSVYGIG